MCHAGDESGFEKKIKIPYSHITCITREYTAVSARGSRLLYSY
jgi:hypothetical protein